MKWIILILLFLPFSIKSQTLHTILVSDVEDPVLGGISLRDEEIIMRIMKTAEWGTGLKLKTYHHNRAGFTAKAVRETLSGMAVGPKDVVFFYYTGLGYYPGKSDKFPTFKLKENAWRSLLFFMSDIPPLSLDEVASMLRKKGARLNLVMADCRDSVPPIVMVMSPSVDEDVRQVFLKKLFLGTNGLVKVASAKKSQRVMGTVASGSIYTRSFEGTFNYLLEARFHGIRQATWPQFLEITKSHPSRFGINILDSTRYQQTPLFEIETGTATQRRNTTQYPSYQYSKTVGEIRGNLARYLEEKGNYQKFSTEFSRAFTKNAHIELVRRNRYPASRPEAKKRVERMSVSQFLSQFEKAAPRIVDVEADYTSVKRTPNKEYLTSLTIIETFEEL